MNLAIHKVYLLLGSNLGDRLEHLSKARCSISELIGQTVLISQLYETEAWGDDSQGHFLNQALAVDTRLSPNEILYIIHQIEQEQGRERHERWAPRTLDIDIAFYDDRIINEKDLIIPHPHIPMRNFALIPLIEIAGHLMHPVLQQTLHDLYDQSMDLSEVTILGGG